MRLRQYRYLVVAFDITEKAGYSHHGEFAHRLLERDLGAD